MFEKPEENIINQFWSTPEKPELILNKKIERKINTNLTPGRVTKTCVFFPTKCFLQKNILEYQVVNLSFCENLSYN